MRTANGSHDLISGRPVRVTKEINQQAFLETLRRTFGAAEQAVGSEERCYSIAGGPLRLRFAGPALVSAVTRAIDHLPTHLNAREALTVFLWDSVSTGVDMPNPPWAEQDYGVHGEIQAYSSDSLHTAYHMASGVLNVLDLRGSKAFYWIRSASEMPSYEIGSPLKIVLHWWLKSLGRRVVHAAAVGTPTHGALIVGKGGSGKSTTALACLRSSLLHAGDDYVILGDEEVPFIHSLYNSIKVDSTHVRRLPYLGSTIVNKERLATEKALVFLRDRFAEKLAMGFPMSAIVIPRVTGRADTKVHEASPAEGFTALAPSAVFQLPGGGRELFQRLADITKRVPSYVLEAGTELDQIPVVIQELLEKS